MTEWVGCEFVKSRCPEGSKLEKGSPRMKPKGRLLICHAFPRGSAVDGGAEPARFSSQDTAVEGPQLHLDANLFDRLGPNN